MTNRIQDLLTTFYKILISNFEFQIPLKNIYCAILKLTFSYSFRWSN